MQDSPFQSAQNEANTFCQQNNLKILVDKNIKRPITTQETNVRTNRYHQQQQDNIEQIFEKEPQYTTKSQQPPQLIRQNSGDIGLLNVLNSEESITHIPTMENLPKQLSYFQKLKLKIDSYMLKSGHDIFMTFLTIYILYADNIRLLLDKSNDEIIFTTTFVCIIVFLSEIFVLSFVRKGYICSFFFWMDLISTISTFMDIPWVIDGLGLSVLSNQQNFSQLNQAGKATRVSSRATKIIRVLRLIRIIRITKLYKYAQQSIQEKFKIDHIDNQDGFESSPDNEPIEPSSCGAIDLSPMFIIKQQNSQFNKRSTPINIPSQIKEQKDALYLYDQQSIINRVPFFQKQRLAVQRENIYTIPVKESFEPSQQSDPSAQNFEKENVLYSKRKSTALPRASIITKNPIKIVDSGNDIADIMNLKGTIQRVSVEIAQIQREQIDRMQETNVGRRLSDLTTKKAILLMLSIMFSIPLFDFNTYINLTTSYDTGLQLLLKNQQKVNFNFQLKEFIYFSQTQGSRTPICFIQIDDSTMFQTEFSQYRAEELQVYQYQNALLLIITYQDSELNAILGLAQTTFIIIIMVTGALYFSKDSTKLVVVPIENMINKVKRIANNPLEAAQMQEDQEILEQEQNQNSNKWKKHIEQNTFETVVLERLIIKIGSLMAIGFGEAGGAIIAENMKKGDSVNPMIKGRKMVAIFGFCDIRNFTDMTEILQEQVMLFVNDIALIVHQNVHMTHGSANKNIGDAFLLVWRIPDTILTLVQNEEYSISNIFAVNNFADLALLSFIRIMIQIKKSMSLDQLCQNPVVLDRLPGYSVKLGYGLHIGWAIEGAIGSHLKIDASYLSPSVNMAARLETATKQYGVQILLSGQFYHFLSQQVKDMTRFIDRITVKGSIQPIDLFTYDADLNTLQVDLEVPEQSGNKKLLKYIQRKKQKQQYDKIIRSRFRMHNHFFQDEDIKAIRKPYTDEFFRKFEFGLENYILGQWKTASVHLQDVQELMLHDGPSSALISFMQKYDYQAPYEWRGFRELTDK